MFYPPKAPPSPKSRIQPNQIELIEALDWHRWRWRPTGNVGRCRIFEVSTCLLAGLEFDDTGEARDETPDLDYADGASGELGRGQNIDVPFRAEVGFQEDCLRDGGDDHRRFTGVMRRKRSEQALEVAIHGTDAAPGHGCEHIRIHEQTRRPGGVARVRA